MEPCKTGGVHPAISVHSLSDSAVSVGVRPRCPSGRDGGRQHGMGWRLQARCKQYASKMQSRCNQDAHSEATHWRTGHITVVRTCGYPPCTSSASANRIRSGSPGHPPEAQQGHPHQTATAACAPVPQSSWCIGAFQLVTASPTVNRREAPTRTTPPKTPHNTSTTTARFTLTPSKGRSRH